MIDIHCHILPNIDDGTKDQTEMLQLAKEAVSDGVTAVIATPHHRNGLYVNPREEVIPLIQKANRLFRDEEIPLTLYPGQEIRVYEDLIVDLKKKQVLSLADQGRHLLLELPSNSVPPKMEHLIYELLLLGMQPIIPHPERNRAIRAQPHLLYRMVREGAAAQLTAGSLTGRFGRGVQQLSLSFIEHRLIHLIATDAHHPGGRREGLKAAYRKIDRTYGSGPTDGFKENAEKVLSGDTIAFDEPVKPSRRKILGLF